MTSNLRIIMATLCLVLPVYGQELKMEVAQRGSSDFFVAAKAVDVTAIDLLSALAEKTGYGLDIASAEVARILDETVISTDFKNTDVAELVDLVGLSAGLKVDTLPDIKKIKLTLLPQPGEGDASEYFRKQALDAVLQAYGGDLNPENEIELKLRSARLHEAGGQMAEAYNDYEAFTERHEAHPLFAAITLSAAEVAIKAGFVDKALAQVNRFLEKVPAHADMGKALMLGAKARLERNDLRGAMSLYMTVIRQALEQKIPERDGLVAEYLVAQLHHKNGDHDAAIKLLEEIEWRHDARQNRDLLDQVWLYLGICRRAAGNRRDALHDLNLAVFTNMAPKIRIRTLLLQAEIYLDLENPFFALNAARAAVALEAEGEQLFRALTTQGKAYRALLLHERAQDTLLDAVIRSPDLIPDEKLRIEKTIMAMNEVAEDFFEDSQFGDALVTFRQINESVKQQNEVALKTGAPGARPVFAAEFVAEIQFMIARCEAHLDRPKDALTTVDAIRTETLDEEFLTRLRQFRGDCFMALKMYERAIRSWNEGDNR